MLDFRNRLKQCSPNLAGIVKIYDNLESIRGGLEWIQFRLLRDSTDAIKVKGGGGEARR